MAWLQASLGSFFTGLSKVFTALGSEKVLVAVMGFFYWCWDKKTGLYAGINVAMSLVLNPMIKNAACRRRPYFDCPGVECLVPVEPSADLYDITAQGWSFPSGHSANSMAVYGSLLARTRGRVLKALYAVVIVLIGLSRVVVGCHFPTDVLGGWILAALVFALVPALRRALPDKRIFYLVTALVSSLGFFWCRTSDYYSGLGIMIGMFAADLFEERFVRFSNTRRPLYCVLRLAGGLLVFLGVSSALKLPFSSEFLASPVPAAFAVRTFRYAAAVFACMGVYPMIFKVIEKTDGQPSAKASGKEESIKSII